MKEIHPGSLRPNAAAQSPLSIDMRCWVRLWPGATIASVHYWISLALWVFLLPLAASTILVLEPPIFLVALFTKVACSGISLAAILHVIDTPIATTLQALRKRPERLLLPLLMATTFVGLLGWSVGLLLSSVAAITVEFCYRNPIGRVTIAWSLLAPALYLLLGIAIIFFYNDIAVSWRFPFSYDPLFMRLDAWAGVDVTAFSKHVAANSPGLLTWAERAYFGMFDVLGGTLILVVLRRGVAAGMRFAGALVLAYYLTLLLFVLFPSQGPYALCADHASSFPHTLKSYPLQMSLVARAQEIWEHTSLITTAGGYYISFPSMHVVKPAVALWYLRSSRRIVLLLVAYLFVLLFAIVVLEMHYVVDILAGLAIAAFVIRISDHPSRLLGQVSRGSGYSSVRVRSPESPRKSCAAV